MSPTAAHLRVGLTGLLLGFISSRIGFSDWGEINRMFRLVDTRLLATFGAGLVLVAAGFLLLRGDRSLPPKPIHKGSVAGGVLFGAGWAITGACPAVGFVQLGEGKLAALCTLAGFVVGIRVYRMLHARYFRWDTGTCS